MLFVIGAAITNIWVPRALPVYVGRTRSAALLSDSSDLLLTRWEISPRGVHYTPNRALILMITLLVTARLFYGLWRGWHNWRAAVGGDSWLAQSGAEGSLAAGAVVLGYYVIYWAGVRRRLRAR